MQNKLGTQYRILEEGLNGRTTVYNDAFTPFKGYGVGVDVLPMILDSHRPLDLVIVMLGTNDLQPHRQADPRDAARGAGRCLEQVLKSLAGPEGKSPQLLLVLPPALKKPTGYMECSFKNMAYNSEEVGRYFKMTADAYGAEFVNAGSQVVATEIDGIHLDEENNKVLAEMLYKKIQDML